MKRLMMAVTVAIALSLTGAAVAQETTTVDAKTTAKVEAMLSGFEYVPTAAEWRKLGPDAAVALRQIAADPKEMAIRRGRAVSALAYFTDASNFTALSSLLNDTATPEQVKRKALLTLALAHGDKAVTVIEPFAAASSRDVRESAIKALGQINTPTARAVLEARVEIEPKAQLRDTIRLSLKKQPSTR